MKTCPRCKVEKPRGAFAINSARHDGSQSWCKECQRERWAEQGPKSRRRYPSRTYGVSEDDYFEMLAEQNYRCAICRDKYARNLCVDHCHKTGIVRGLLCSRCNAGVGMLGDSAEGLEVALGYLLSAPTYAARKEAA